MSMVFQIWQMNTVAYNNYRSVASWTWILYEYCTLTKYLIYVFSDWIDDTTYIRPTQSADSQPPSVYVMKERVGSQHAETWEAHDNKVSLSDTSGALDGVSRCRMSIFFFKIAMSHVSDAYFPTCHMSNLSKYSHVSCHYLFYPHVACHLAWWSQVDLKKIPCRCVEFRGQWPYLSDNKSASIIDSVKIKLFSSVTNIDLWGDCYQWALPRTCLQL